jgi:hypothetical protein
MKDSRNKIGSPSYKNAYTLCTKSSDKAASEIKRAMD